MSSSDVVYQYLLCPLGIIAAGTNRGSIAFWVYHPNQRTADAEKHWTLQRTKNICNEVPVRKLKVTSTQHAWTIVCIHPLRVSTARNGTVLRPI
jgi:hypothetical protein